jgi:hypothetical protein
MLQEVGRDIFLIFILPHPFFQGQRILVLVRAKTQNCYDMIERGRFTQWSLLFLTVYCNMRE